MKTRKWKKPYTLMVIICIIPLSTNAQIGEQYSVKVNKIKATIQPTMWGLFFEDINRGADGGMYAEMVENRSFDFPKPMMKWTVWPPNLREGIFTVVKQNAENPANPKYLSVSIGAGDTVGLANAGFEGMAFKKNLTYQLTLRYRQQIAGIHIRSILYNATNKVIARAELNLESLTGSWKEQTINLTPSDTTTNGKLLVIFEGTGKMDVDRISLFPTDTWKAHPSGLRADLVQKLADMHPGFLRFPGGCIVEGKDLNYRYQWKNTIGPIDTRKLVQSIWNDDVPERQTPDYFESNGLGFYEYFQLCEDIGAAPVPILNCGMSCQFDAAEVVPVNELDPYIQDALDLVEFANGNTQTKWGAKRAEMGHPAPFNMKMLGVGNENWGPQYVERLKIFIRAIKEKYPEVKLICATGYSARKASFDFMDSSLRAMKVDIIDEHYYMPPDWFLQNSNKYDHYDRKGPKIFVGEYAAQSDRIGSMNNKNNLKTALSEAAFMTGLERNADIVSMASYAPLFAHVRDWQWAANLIWFDNSRSYNTPNYYVQQLFSVNKGTAVVSMLLDRQAIQGQDSIWASAVIDKNTNDLVIKIVNMSAIPKQKTINTDARLEKIATVTTLSNPDLNIMNSLDNPTAIAPAIVSIETQNKIIKLELKPYSFSLIKVKLKR